VDEFSGLGRGAFVSARQENLETIHKHDVVAECHGLITDLEQELSGGTAPSRHVTMRNWLEGS